MKPYTASQPLHRMRLLEPSFGGGAFVLAAVARLLLAFKAAGGGAADLADCIRAVELHRSTFHATRQKIDALLLAHGLASLAQALQPLYNKLRQCCITRPQTLQKA